MTRHQSDFLTGGRVIQPCRPRIRGFSVGSVGPTVDQDPPAIGREHHVAHSPRRGGESRHDVARVRVQRLGLRVRAHGDAFPRAGEDHARGLLGFPELAVSAHLPHRDTGRSSRPRFLGRSVLEREESAIEVESEAQEVRAVLTSNHRRRSVDAPQPDRLAITGQYRDPRLVGAPINRCWRVRDVGRESPRTSHRAQEYRRRACVPHLDRVV